MKNFWLDRKQVDLSQVRGSSARFKTYAETNYLLEQLRLKRPSKKEVKNG